MRRQGSHRTSALIAERLVFRSSVRIRARHQHARPIGADSASVKIDPGEDDGVPVNHLISITFPHTPG